MSQEISRRFRFEKVLQLLNYKVSVSLHPSAFTELNLVFVDLTISPVSNDKLNTILNKVTLEAK